VTHIKIGRILSKVNKAVEITDNRRDNQK